MSKRAIRRAHKIRMIEHAKRIYKYIFNNKDEEQAKKNADHLASCNCWMCKNPRKVFNDPTMQEKRQTQEKLKISLMKVIKIH